MHNAMLNVSITVSQLFDVVATRQMGLYTSTQPASVRPMATTMLSLFRRLLVMLRHCRRVKVITAATATVTKMLIICSACA